MHVCMCESVRLKEIKALREELISTVFLLAQCSDGYSYYVDDCSCICAADPNFAFCVASSFTQRSKTPRLG